MTYNRIFATLLALLTIGLTSCKDDDHSPGELVNLEEMIDGEISFVLNPSGRAPLSAQLNFNSKVPSRVSITIMGQIPVSSNFKSFSRVHNDPIVGLYPNSSNEVHIEISDAYGRYAKSVIEITTGALYEGLPDISIDAKVSGQLNSDMILSDFHMGNTGFFTSCPLAFDEDGVIRWCLDLREFKEIAWPTRRLRNGNMVFVVASSIYEVDMLGNYVKIIPIPGYHAHHDVIELPNGNYIVAVDKAGTTIEKNGTVETVEDFAIEVNRASGSVVQEWDMREILDVDRIDLHDGDGDWFHMNAIEYSESDDCLIISGRNQCVVKVNRENELKWIIAPHKGWGKSGADGSGNETTPYLLTAIDGSGQAYSQDIQDGNSRSTDFDWPWGQHAPVILKNGNLLLFDNGFKRQYTGSSLFSRAVEYDINESNNTIKEVWSFGEVRGPDCFSSIISNAQFIEPGNSVIFSPGFITSGGAPNSKVIEVSYPDNSVVFEATLNHKISLLREIQVGERLILYTALLDFLSTLKEFIQP